MMNQAEIEAYIDRLPNNSAFTELPQEVKDKVVFGSYEMLRRRYGAAVITSEMAALQTLYAAEGEKEEFAKFKRQGVKSFGMEGMNFSFEMTHISPEVLALVELIQAEEAEAAAGGVIFGELR